MLIKMLYSLYKSFSNMMIRKKLFLSYVLLILIPLVSFFALSYKDISRSFENQVQFSLRQSFELSTQLLDSSFEKMHSTSDAVLTNAFINDLLKRPDNSNTDGYQMLMDNSKIQNFLESMQNGKPVFRIRLYISDSYQYLFNNFNIYGIDSLKNEQWYNNIIEKNSRYTWLSSDILTPGNDQQDLISFARNLVDYTNYNNTLGYMVVDIHGNSLKEVLRNTIPTRNGVVFIQDSDGRIAASSNTELIRSLNPTDKMINITNATKDWVIVDLNSVKYLKGIRYIPSTGWYLVSLIPYSEITQAARSMLIKMLLVLILLLIVASGFSYFLAYIITKRLNHVVKRMRDIQNGNMSTIVTNPCMDETGELVKNYNYMVHRISDLLEEKFSLGKKANLAELKALQAQINPHFLYNTLEMISWIAEDNDSKGVQEIVKSLSNYYKLTLNSGSHIVRLQDEISHITEYVRIQNKRFNNSITLNICIPEEMLDYTLVKLTLQPLVENSILHGIRNKPSRVGTITLKGTLENGLLILEVLDDGIGIPREKLSVLLQNEIKSTSGSYGVWNVHERLRLCYGPDYGLTYDSVEGMYTSVQIRLPAEKMRA